MRHVFLLSYFLLPACAAAGHAADGRPRVADQVRHACIDIMGFNPGEAHYDGCAESLSRTLAGMKAARTLEADRAACAAAGKLAGTRDFALCVNDRQQRQGRES
jgi:hypothetical protein